MSQSTAHIYLIAGATKGIGLALVDTVASKDPSAIIYAGARDPSAASASQLGALAAKYPGRIEIVKYLAGDKETNEALAKQIGAKYGRIDTVIANAGIANYMGKLHETPIDKFTDHFSVNVLGPIVLFQALRALLQASALPRFVPISSSYGSLGDLAPGILDLGPYGTTKAALNWATRKIHFENEWLVAFPQCPGPVDTDLSHGVVSFDESGQLAQMFDQIKRSPEAAAGLLVGIITTATREKDGGEFHSIEGGRHPW
ncbi:NAD(P)-binding protein [Pholiota molesta]|nr:NAD(P)-binding protein [Pholiota molesta]